MAAGGYKMSFNQEFTSISITNASEGYRLFSLSATDKIEEAFSSDTVKYRFVQRLFSSSLVVVVTDDMPKSLKMTHFKKKQDICKCNYPTEILNVLMNRTRLIVCLVNTIHIHNIRDMKILISIENLPNNMLGLCSLSLNSHLAYPISSTSGELRIYNANKLKPSLKIKAHESSLSALVFNSSGTLLATASERGTVIRIFCVANGQRVQEFRRGVKRCVRIASLVFSVSGDFVCATSNTETVHIFKIDPKAVEETERMPSIEAGAGVSKLSSSSKPADARPSKSTDVKPSTSAASTKNKTEYEISKTAVAAAPTPTTAAGGWSNYLSKAVSSYLLPTTVSDVLSQDRAFATVTLAQPGLKHVCALARIEKELRLLIACEDGFLYIHDFSAERGGPCKLLSVHDLRCALEGVIELNLSDSINKLSLSGNPIMSTSTTPTKSCGAARILIENGEQVVDNSYASILRGADQAPCAMTDSTKYRSLMDAIDTPTKLYDEHQFPPVAIAAKD